MKKKVLKFISSIENKYLKSITLVILLPIIWILSIPEVNLSRFKVPLILLSLMVLTPILIYNYHYYKTINNIIDGTPFFGTDRERSGTDYIVIHHDAIPASNKVKLIDIDSFHRYVSYTKKVGDKLVVTKGRGWDCGFAYHYYVNDTAIYQMHNNFEFTIHAGRVNSHGIAICIHGNYENDKPSRSLLFRLIILIRYLQNKYNIPSENVIGHGTVPGQVTSCPGKNIDFDKLRYFLKD